MNPTVVAALCALVGSAVVAGFGAWVARRGQTDTASDKVTTRAVSDSDRWYLRSLDLDNEREWERIKAEHYNEEALGYRRGIAVGDYATTWDAGPRPPLPARPA